MKTIKFGKIPGLLSDFAFEGTITVGEILDQTDTDSSGYEIKVDGITATLDTVVNESNNSLILAVAVKGARVS
jgi:hypothetical protein